MIPKKERKMVMICYMEIDQNGKRQMNSKKGLLCDDSYGFFRIKTSRNMYSINKDFVISIKEINEKFLGDEDEYK